MGEVAKTGNDLPMAFSEVEETGKQLSLICIGNTKKLLELLNGLILDAEIFSVLQHQVDKHSLDRCKQDVAAVGHAVPHKLQCAFAAGERLRCAAMDHARQLVEQQDKREPALRRPCPIVQLTGKCSFAEATETFPRFGILFRLVAEPEAVLRVCYFSGGNALTEPPVQ